MFDLSHAPACYLDLPADELAPHITGDEKPIRRIWPTSQPMLFPLELAPDDVRGGRLRTVEYLDRAGLVQRHPTFGATLAHTLANLQEEGVPSVHVEERIYEAFTSDADTLLMMEFHNVAWPMRPTIAARLTDDRLRKLALRLIYVERRDVLQAGEQTRLDELVMSRLMASDDVPWMTIPKALHEIMALKAEADYERLDRLHEIEEYLLGLSKGRTARAAQVGPDELR